MKFFFDNGISPVIVDALRILQGIQGNELVHLRDKFAQGTDDEVWIPDLADDGDWVIVSADPRITRQKAVRKVWEEAGLTSFFFADGWANKRFWIQARDVVEWWPKVVLECGKSETGTGYLIPVKAKELKKIFPRE